jgi:hypothetical protein
MSDEIKNKRGRKPKTKENYFGINEEDAIKKYEEYFYSRIETDDYFLKEVLKLEGKTLGCFCHPKPCHGQVIIDFLNIVYN